jgi:hypothetical protein
LASGGLLATSGLLPSRAIFEGDAKEFWADRDYKMELEAKS